MRIYIRTVNDYIDDADADLDEVIGSLESFLKGYIRDVEIQFPSASTVIVTPPFGGPKTIIETQVWEKGRRIWMDAQEKSEVYECIRNLYDAGYKCTGAIVPYALAAREE